MKDFFASVKKTAQNALGVITGTELEFYRNLSEEQGEKIRTLTEANMELELTNRTNDLRISAARKALA